MQRMVMDALRSSAAGAATTGTGANQTGEGYVNLADFLNHTFQLHQQQRAGPPPASESAVKNLKEVEVVDEKHSLHGKDCAVCQDAFSQGDKALQLPCEHFFHGDCVRPWLKDHNTCPTCRYELQTDDQEYEQGRKERMERREEAKRLRECQCELGRIRREDCCLFGEPELVTLECGHKLHRECAVEWDRAQRNGKCPACNKPVTFPTSSSTEKVVDGSSEDASSKEKLMPDKKRQRVTEADEEHESNEVSPMVLADSNVETSKQ